MSFFSWVANGIGTLIGVVKEVVTEVVEKVRTAYKAYVDKGGSVKDRAVQEAHKQKDRLREVNDEIMFLRNRSMSRGGLTGQDRRRWNALREERDELMGKRQQAKEVKAAEKIIESEAVLEKVEVDEETAHVMQYNAFADSLGKTCLCGRPMKLQWKRDLHVAGPKDFFWGCTGYYLPEGQGKCNRQAPLQQSDYRLVTDRSTPELKMTKAEFSVILEDPVQREILKMRMDDLRTDLAHRKQSIELVTCPIHGEHMVLKKKSDAKDLLDMFFLACPHWKQDKTGCSYVEKLKSTPQVSALLKSETGTGVVL